MTHVDQAKALFREGKTAEAVNYLENVAEDLLLDSITRQSVVPTLAELYLQQNKKNKAEAILQPLLGNKTTIYEYQAKLIWCQMLFQSSKLTDTKDFIIEAIETFPKSADTDFLCVKGDLIGMLAQIYARQGDLEHSALKFSEALTIMKQANNKVRATAMEYNLASIYGRKGEYEKAITAFSSVIRKQRQANNILGVGYSLMEMGGIYERLGQVEKAVQCYDQEYEIFQSYGGPTQQAWALTDLGNGYLALDQAEKALGYYLECLPHYEENDDRFTRGNIYSYLAKTYLKLNSFDPSLEYAKKAESMYLQVENQDKVYYAKLLQFKVYQKIGDTDNLLRLRDEFNIDIIETFSDQDLISLYNQLSVHFEDFKNI